MASNKVQEALSEFSGQLGTGFDTRNVRIRLLVRKKVLPQSSQSDVFTGATYDDPPEEPPNRSKSRHRLVCLEPEDGGSAFFGTKYTRGKPFKPSSHLSSFRRQSSKI